MTSIAHVLKRAGYATHHAGKWHGGMSHAAQLPVNRGFDSSLAMLAGAADHYTNVRENFVDLWLNSAPAHGLNGTYSLYNYMDHALSVIAQHDPATPLFLYMAYQDVHGPTECPDRFLSPYNTSIYTPRRKGLGQISAVDEALLNLTSALRAKRMWEQTLFIFSSDNGGPVDHEPNYPLRGAKGSDWEGGTRVVAFITGGMVPQAQRGGTIDGLVHVCDWYATFASLAGVADVTDHAAAAAGLPPVDSIDVWPLLAGSVLKSPRSEVPLSGYLSSSPDAITGTGLIVHCPIDDVCPGSHSKWKLLRGQQGNNFFPGPTTPNGTDHKATIDCGDGCLFSLDDDPTEHVDLAWDKPELLGRLQKRAAQLDRTVYQSPGGVAADPMAKKAAIERYGGFWGPWQDDAAHAAMARRRGMAL